MSPFCETATRRLGDDELFIVLVSGCGTSDIFHGTGGISFESLYRRHARPLASVLARAWTATAECVPSVPLRRNSRPIIA